MLSHLWLISFPLQRSRNAADVFASVHHFLKRAPRCSIVSSFKQLFALRLDLRYVEATGDSYEGRFGEVWFSHARPNI